MPMKEMFGTYDEFLHFVNTLGSDFVFRGHSSSDYQLLPSIGREHPKYTPDKTIEADLLHQFRLKAPPFTDFSPQTEMDWLILGRHYGLKTRILDWTRNRYIACYFALLPAVSEDVTPFSVIIVKNPKITNYFTVSGLGDPLSINDVCFFEPPHFDFRITNQSSVLSIHPNPFTSYSEGEIFQFNFYPSERLRMENALFEMGITHSSVRPGLDGLCSHINDNPTGIRQSLSNKPSGIWTVSPKLFAGHDGEVISDSIFKHGSFLSVFHAKEPLSLIGVPVELEGEIVGYFRSFYPDLEELEFFTKDYSERVKCDLYSEFVRTLKINKTDIQRLFPVQRLYFASRLPSSGKNNFKLSTLDIAGKFIILKPGP